MTGYLLDTNIFIQAKNLHYGFDFCPAFWDWLVVQNGRGKVASVEKVADELLVGRDDLSAWARERGSGFFLKPDGGVVDALRTVSMWAIGGEYRPDAVSTFLRLADCWLIAQALAYKHIVVTHEVSAGTARKIKIPDACDALGLRCMTPYTKVRDAGLMLGALRRAPLPLGGRGWGRASRRDGRLCRASPAAPAGAEAAPHPASPASGRGVCRRQSA